MLRLHLDHGIDAFYTIDDVFSLDRERVVDMPWAHQTQSQDSLDNTDPRRLDRSRPIEVDETGRLRGCENGNRVRCGPNPQGHSEKLQSNELLEAARNCQKAGLILTTYYMVGHPTETRAEMEETFAFAKLVGSDMVQMAFHTPTQGRSLTKWCATKWRI